MYESCIQKQNKVKNFFNACQSEEERYQKIMELGRSQVQLKPEHKTHENLVKGCQSRMYLYSYIQEGKIIFEAESDALISAGLAALLVQVYSGEIPEVVLKCPPTYLDELGIFTKLTPTRANGLYSMHLHMKQDALKLMMEQQKKG